METEIKEVMENLVNTLLASVSGHIKGEGNETIEEIKIRNLDIAYLKMNKIIKPLLNKRR
jgi:hypothetical protein